MAVAMPLSKMPEIDFYHKLGNSDPHRETNLIKPIFDLFTGLFLCEGIVSSLTS